MALSYRKQKRTAMVAFSSRHFKTHDTMHCNYIPRDKCRRSSLQIPSTPLPTAQHLTR